MKVPKGYVERGTANSIVIINMLMSKFVKLLMDIPPYHINRRTPNVVKVIEPTRPVFIIFYKDGIIWTVEELLKKPLIDLINMGDVDYYFYERDVYHLKH